MTTNARSMLPLVTLALWPLLAACSRPSAPATDAPAARATADASQPETVLGRTVDSAIQKARRELETGNIDLGDGPDVNVGNHGRHFRIGQASDGTKAQLTPKGDLIIEGKTVPVTPEQRALLLDYRRQIIVVAESGMAIGVKGADLAGKAVLDTFAGLMHGDTQAASKHIESEGQRLQEEAKQICTQLPALMAAQQRVAAALPEFKPYANMTPDDIDDCLKDDDHPVEAGTHAAAPADKQASATTR